MASNFTGYTLSCATCIEPGHNFRQCTNTCYWCNSKVHAKDFCATQPGKYVEDTDNKWDEFLLLECRQEDLKNTRSQVLEEATQRVARGDISRDSVRTVVDDKMVRLIQEELEWMVNKGTLPFHRFEPEFGKRKAEYKHLISQPVILEDANKIEKQDTNKVQKQDTDKIQKQGPNKGKEKKSYRQGNKMVDVYFSDSESEEDDGESLFMPK